MIIFRGYTPIFSLYVAQHSSKSVCLKGSTFSPGHQCSQNYIYYVSMEGIFQGLDCWWKHPFEITLAWNHMCLGLALCDRLEIICSFAGTDPWLFFSKIPSGSDHGHALRRRGGFPSARFLLGSFMFSKQSSFLSIRQMHPPLINEAVLQVPAKNVTVVNLLLQLRNIYGQLSEEHTIHQFLWSLEFIPGSNRPLLSPTHQQFCAFHLQIHVRPVDLHLNVSLQLSQHITHRDLSSSLYCTWGW